MIKNPFLLYNNGSFLADKEPSIPRIVIPTAPPSPDHEDIVISKQRETAAIYRTAPQRSLSLTHVPNPSRPTAPQRRSTISAKSLQPPSPRSSRPTLHGYGSSTDSLGAPTSIRLLGPEPYIDLNSTKHHTPPKNRRPSAYSSFSASSSSSSSSCSSCSIERKKSINDSTSRHEHKRVVFKTTTSSHATTTAAPSKALPPTPSPSPPSNMIANTR